MLLITSADVSQATAKLYEYVAAGRPILALTGDNEAARIVRDTQTGITVPPEAMAALMETAINRRARRSRD